MSYGFGYINDLASRIEKNAIAKGFWAVANVPGNGEMIKGTQLEDLQVATKLGLIHSEVSEAMEAHRDLGFTAGSINGKPEGFVYELADVVIRVLDLADHFGLNIEQAIVDKMAYNESRPYMHGKKY